MEISEQYVEPTSSPSISFAVDFHVKTSRRPESVPASRALAQVFGLSTPVWWGNFDHDGCSLRTSQGSLFTTQCDELSENWPDSGMWDAGAVYELRSSEPVTCESACSSWPTPVVSDQYGKREVMTPMGNGFRRVSHSGKSNFGSFLNDAVAMWPTATVDDMKSSGSAGYSTESGRHAGTTPTDATRNWPTPQQHDSVGGKTAEQLAAHRERTGAGACNLNETAEHWATPNAHDGRRPGSDATSTQGANLKRDAECWNSHPDPPTPDGNKSSLIVQTWPRQLAAALGRVLSSF